MEKCLNLTISPLFGMPIDIIVSQSDTVLDIKKKSFEEIPDVGPAEGITLLYMGTVLQDHQTIIELNLQNKAELELVKAKSPVSSIEQPKEKKYTAPKSLFDEEEKQEKKSNVPKSLFDEEKIEEKKKITPKPKSLFDEEERLEKNYPALKSMFEEE